MATPRESSPTPLARRMEPKVGTERLSLVLLVAAAVLLALVLTTPLLASDRGFSGFLATRSGEVLEAQDASRLLTPGSVQKLVVSAAALHYLGPEHRVRTAIRATAAPRDGTVAGDLVVSAAADPTWNTRFFPDDPRAPLSELARRVAARGARRVTGALVVDLSRFPGRRAPPSRAYGELPFAWAAPTSGLAVDDNALSVRIAPGARVGEPGSAILLPPADTEGWRLTHRITTAPRARHERGTVDFLPRWNSRELWIGGEYPVSEPAYRVGVSVPDPEQRAAQALAAAFAEAGIEVAGGVRLSSTPIAATVEIAHLDSPTVAEILPEILRESHNWTTEMLLRIVAAEILGEGRLDDGLDLLGRFLEEEVGVDPKTFALDDASGISPYNLLSPESTVALLAWAWQRPWRDAWLAALAHPGGGSLAAWPTLPKGLRAKTGTVRQSQSLAGYILPSHRGASVEPVVFAAFLNHRPDQGPQLRAEIAAWVRQVAVRATP